MGLNMRTLNDQGIIDSLHAYNRLPKSSGLRLCFNIVIEDEGRLSVIEYKNRPCYGELRKYERTHPGDCTQPEVRWPADLTQGFPRKGTPVGLGLRFNHFNSDVSHNKIEGDNRVTLNKMAEFIFSKHSPWKKGFEKGKYVEITYDSDGNVCGVVLRSSHFDPTVLINLIFCLRSSWHNNKIEMYNSVRSLGLGEKASWLYIASQVSQFIPFYNFNSSNISLKRFFDQNPQDLTGGSWHDRWDYNRPKVMNIFSAGEGEEGINLLSEMKKRNPTDSAQGFKILLEEKVG